MNDQQRVKEIIRAFHTPMVFSPGGWGNDLPKYWQERVIRQRLEMIDNGTWTKATDAEVACYLSSASLEAPLDHNWTTIFVYYTALLLGTQVYEALGEGDEKHELTEYQKMEVEHLKHQIRDKQIRVEKGNIKGGTMNKRKILIEEREDGVLLAVSRDGVDPFVKKVGLTWEQMMDQMPFAKGVAEIAEEQWKIQPKNPAYVAPPKPKTETPKAAPAPKKGTKAKPEPPPAEPPEVKPEPPLNPEQTPDTPPEIEARGPLAPGAENVEFHAPELQQVSTPKVDEQKPPEAPPAPPTSTTKTRTSSDSFQYKLKDGRGPFVSIQEALDAMGMDKTNRPLHNRYDRLSKKLQEEILQEKKA